MDREVLTVILILLVIGFLWLAGQTSIFSGIGRGGPKLEPSFEVKEIKEAPSKRQGLNIFEKGFNSIKREGNDIFKRGLFKRDAATSNSNRRQNGIITINLNESKYKNKISMRVSGAREENPLNEWVELSVSSSDTDSVPITGWKIKNSRNEELVIKQAAYIIYSASINQQNDIILKKGQKAFLIIGKSPIGANFLTNICAGYFNQFHKFNPSLKQNCPHPGDEPEISSAGLSDNCLDFIDGLPKCAMPFPSSLSLDIPCVNYINQNINYDGCVKSHKFDADFYGNEWRIYFGRDQKFFKQSREKINLYDEDGKKVESIEY